MDKSVTTPPVEEKKGLAGDYGSIFILLLLYILQGVPIGISDSMPLILQSYKITYSQQALFSLANFSFSLKLLWAPLVDSVYFKKFGRRKSWVIPAQYAIGLFMLLLSFKIDDLLGPLPEDDISFEWSSDNNSTKLFNITLTTAMDFNTTSDQISRSSPSVYTLAAAFFFLNFLCATQDIALDAWALTMVSKQNVVYGATCNRVGQTFGIFLGYTVFLALQSPDLSNKYLRSTPSDTGLLTLSGYLMFWAIVFLVVTAFVMLFKREEPEKSEKESILDTYAVVLKILKLKSIQSLVLILLTYQIAFSITSAATELKMIEYGLLKETIALMKTPLILLQIILPWYISKYSKGPRPLNLFLKAFMFNLISGIIYAPLLYWTKKAHNPITDSFPIYFYAVTMGIFILHQMVVDTIDVASMGFFARVSDPLVGATYMTLLNTINNLGIKWPKSTSLWLLDYVTWKGCTIGESSCNNAASIAACTAVGGQCRTTIDGYYVELSCLTLFGLLWFIFARKRVRKIESLPSLSWSFSQLPVNN